MKRINKYIMSACLMAGMMSAGEGVMWGGSDKYANVTTKMSPETGAGTAYVAAGDSFSGTETYVVNSVNGSGSQTVTFSLKATENDGYHFTEWTTTAGSLTNANQAATTLQISSNNESSPGESATATAYFEKNYYIKVISQSNNTTWGTVSAATNTTDNTKQASQQLSYTLTATPNTNYHFVSWKKTAGDADGTISGNSFTGKTSSKPGEYNNYTVTGTFDINVYYASLAVDTNGNGSVKVDQTSKSTSEKAGGNVTFEISATSDSGYHFVKWSKSGDVGTFGNETSASTTFTAPAGTSHGATASYTVTATFAQDQYNANLSTHVSSGLAGTSAGTAKISSDGGTTYTLDSYTTSASTSAGDVTFKIKAEPKKGYQFKGWADSDKSTSYKPLAAVADYTVKSHETEGQTRSYDLYAVFDKGTYTVQFLKNEGGRTVGGSMADQGFTSGVSQTLSKNQYVCNVSVTYNAQGGTCSKASEVKSRFSCWTELGSSPTVTYSDQASINRMENHGTTVKLSATWNSDVEFTLPSPTKTHYGESQKFLGWYDAPTGGTKIGEGGATVKISDDTKTLYAHWEECNIVINTNLTSGEPTTDRVVFSITKKSTTGDPYQCRIPVKIGSSIVLKDVPTGTYEVVAASNWSWAYTVSTVSPKEVNAAETVFDFTVTSKGSSKKNDEQIKTITISE